eukprot:scaffold3734_cov425-Prasinococcus_capsulatus_cf.AAC.16
MRKTEVHALAVIASLAVLLGLVFHHHRSVDELHLQARSGRTRCLSALRGVMFRRLALSTEQDRFTGDCSGPGHRRVTIDTFERRRGSASPDAHVVSVWVECAGEQLARSLLEKSLVACVNLLPKVTSMYKWEGRVRTDPEVLLVCTNVNASSNQSFHVMKTSTDKAEQLAQAIVNMHPYAVPEILLLPVQGGLNSYIEWLAEG